MIAFSAERLMELELAPAGVAYCEKSSGRRAERNGHRDRVWGPAGTVEPRVPDLRTSNYLPATGDSEMALHVLAYNLYASHQMIGIKPLIAA